MMPVLMRGSSISTAALFTLVVFGCGDSDGAGASNSGGSGGTGAGTSDGAGGSGNGGAPNGGAPSDGGGGSTGEAAGCPMGGAPGTGGGVETCEEIGAESCFSNYDCEAADRCENQGSSDLPTPCCVAGARGTGELGTACLVDNDCASSLCIEGGACGFVCSDRCEDASTCPKDLPECIVIAFSGTEDKFCVPASKK